MTRAITMWTQSDIKASKRLIEQIDALSRVRALNDRESLLLDRSLAIVDRQRIPRGLNKAVARFSIGRRHYRLPVT